MRMLVSAFKSSFGSDAMYWQRWMCCQEKLISDRSHWHFRGRIRWLYCTSEGQVCAESVAVCRQPKDAKESGLCGRQGTHIRMAVGRRAGAEPRLREGEKSPMLAFMTTIARTFRLCSRLCSLT